MTEPMQVRDNQGGSPTQAPVQLYVAAPATQGLLAFADSSELFNTAPITGTSVRALLQAYVCVPVDTECLQRVICTQGVTGLVHLNALVHFHAHRSQQLLHMFDIDACKSVQKSLCQGSELRPCQIIKQNASSSLTGI